MEFNTLIDVVFPVDKVISFEFKVGMTPGTTAVRVLPMPVCVVDTFGHTKMVIVRCLSAMVKILLVVGDEYSQSVLNCSEAMTHQLDTAYIFPEVVHAEILCTLIFQYFNVIRHFFVEPIYLFAVPLGFVLQFYWQKLIAFAHENIQLQFVFPDVIVQLLVGNIIFHIYIVVMTSASKVVSQVHLQVALIEQQLPTILIEVVTNVIFCQIQKFHIYFAFSILLWRPGRW